MTCQGVPPTCMECNEGYTVNAMDNTMCGELYCYTCNTSIFVDVFAYKQLPPPLGLAEKQLFNLFCL